MARTNSNKLTPAVVLQILHSRESNAALAAQLGVTRQAISLIRNGKAWKDVAPEIPRVPIRIKESVPFKYRQMVKHCSNCLEFQGGECSFGFPEAIHEPSFAAICDLYHGNC